MSVFSAPELRAQRPGDGMPLTSMHPGYTLINLRPQNFGPGIGGIDWLSDGRLVVLDWGKHQESIGAVYILKGTDQTASQVTYKKFAEGFKEPLGLVVVNDTIYVLAMNKLVRLIDKDKDGVAELQEIVTDKWPYSGTFHEFAMGLTYRDGYFFFNTAMAVVPGGKPMVPQPIANRGMHLKVSRTGVIEYVAGGLRTPNGIGYNRDGETFVTDNQGGYLPASKIINVKPGRFYGHYATPPNKFDGQPESPPALWLPQEEIANSPSQPLFIPSGLFEGQLLYGDIHYGGIQRVFLEKVAGEYQGSVFRFLAGLEAGVNRLLWGKNGSLYAAGIGTCGVWSFNCTGSGLQRMDPTGKGAFEMKSVRSRPRGFEIEFTEPVGASGDQPSSYTAKTWWYKPTNDYGGPKMEPRTLAVKSVLVSPDRKSVYLEMDGLQTNHVVYLRAGITNASGGPLWSAETWYTLNAIGTGEPFTSPVPVRETASPFEGSGKWTINQGQGRIGIEVHFEGAWTFELRKPDGSLLKSSAVLGDRAEFRTDGYSGVVLVSARSRREVLSRLITLP